MASITFRTDNERSLWTNAVIAALHSTTNAVVEADEVVRAFRERNGSPPKPGPRVFSMQERAKILGTVARVLDSSTSTHPKIDAIKKFRELVPPRDGHGMPGFYPGITLKDAKVEVEHFMEWGAWSPKIDDVLAHSGLEGIVHK